ncbi:hypothetical protein Dda_3275 [Drechslerella dactyloides]|uniref:Uncharacterized protein n=1 Tax=Drechslerella dactyloides TaxID=74499 RepID=A0AAD6J5J6_DREDA|nr:hypothetical protein Dda_3275 [Drechslerella dactyloides]
MAPPSGSISSPSPLPLLYIHLPHQLPSSSFRKLCLRLPGRGERATDEPTPHDRWGASDPLRTLHIVWAPIAGTPIQSIPLLTHVSEEGSLMLTSSWKPMKDVPQYELPNSSGRDEESHKKRRESHDDKSDTAMTLCSQCKVELAPFELLLGLNPPHPPTYLKYGEKHGSSTNVQSTGEGCSAKSSPRSRHDDNRSFDYSYEVVHEPTMSAHPTYEKEGIKGFVFFDVREGEKKARTKEIEDEDEDEDEEGEGEDEEEEEVSSDHVRLSYSIFSQEIEKGRLIDSGASSHSMAHK